MILIGLGHKARQGKNFVANYMVEEATRGLEANSYDELVDKYITTAPKLYAFADELKLYCKENHEGLLEEWCKLNPYKGVTRKEDPIYGYTQILQWYGTDIARKADPDTWVKALAARIQSEQPGVAIVTDVRFQNEADYIKKAGGFMVEVIRLNADGTRFLDSGRDPNHPSETALDDYEEWDFVISAKDGDLKGLKAKSIGVYNLASRPDDYEEYYVDEPDYSWDVLQSIEGDNDATGFKS